MTIRDRDKFMETLWDWKFLESSLGGRIRPSDLDGIVERKGKVLLLEAKSPGVTIPTGQQIMFDHLVNARCPHCGQKIGRIDVLVIWGERNQPEQMRMWRIHDHPIDATEADIQKMVDRWYKWAEKNVNSR